MEKGRVRVPPPRRPPAGSEGTHGPAHAQRPLDGRCTLLAMDGTFRLEAPFEPQGDQPRAIGDLVGWLRGGTPAATLLGITGSGKTFTMAKVIAELSRPTLVLSPNKTLAAQLYAEFRELFPSNAVESVSYTHLTLPTILRV